MQLPVQKSLMQKPIFPSLFKNFTIFFAYFEFVVLEALKFLSVKKISHWKKTKLKLLLCSLTKFQILLKVFPTHLFNKPNSISLETDSFSITKVISYDPSKGLSLG